MTRCYLVRLSHTTCEEVYGEKCSYDEGKDECENCATIYEGESQEVIDDLMHIGYEVQDIHESELIGNWKEWWVKVTGCRDKEIEPDSIEFV